MFNSKLDFVISLKDGNVNFDVVEVKFFILRNIFHVSIGIAGLVTIILLVGLLVLVLSPCTKK